MKKLLVLIDTSQVGLLVDHDSGDYTFSYTDSWLGGNDSIPLSQSLPLQEETFSPATSKAFFSNLLPEGQIRDYFANKHRVSADDDFGLLAALGGDCAGALSLQPDTLKSAREAQTTRYKKFTDDELVQLLDEAYIMDPSFLRESERPRLSLAGAQDKLPIVFDGKSIYLPLDGSPSTHILKPASSRFSNLVENEAFCMALARAMGLDVPNTILHKVADKEFVYIITRYDRQVDNEGVVTKTHQEDFCQATGHSYRLKYEEKGGPGFRACFQTVNNCRAPFVDRFKLINLAIYNYLINNADCHAKNISLLYDNGTTPSLAPFYDLVCTGAYPPLTKRMAMKIGESYGPGDISIKSWSTFAEEVGAKSINPVVNSLKKMASTIPAHATEVARFMTEQYGENEIYQQIIECISNKAATTIRQIERFEEQEDKDQESRRLSGYTGRSENSEV